MFSPNRREFMQYSGVAAGGLFGLPPLEVELAALDDDLDKSTPKLYLDIPGIPGEVTHDGAEGTIGGFAYRWSHEGATDGSERGRGRHRGHVTVLKAIDKSTPLLHQACANEATLPEATITLTRSDERGKREEYYTHHLENVTVASVDTGQYGDQMVERCVLSFERCVVEYAGVRPVRIMK